MPDPAGSQGTPRSRPAAPADGRAPTWGAEALWQQLSPLLPGLSVEVLARVESTNSELLDRARGAFRSPGRDLRSAGSSRPEPAEAPGTGSAPGRAAAAAGPAGRSWSGPGRRADDAQACLLVAEHQTRGRGRLGRDWRSSAGASLTFSLSLPMHPRDWSGLSLAVGQAIADALDPPGAGPVRIGLKWPNDLWILDTPGRGRKLGGILIETVAHGDQRTVVIGVGLNIRPLAPSADRSSHHPAERAPDDQPEAATLTHGLACLQELDPAASAPGALAALALPLVQALQRFEREGFAACQPAYARRDLLVGQPLTTLGGTQSLQGRSEGVGTDGALLLRCPDGTLARIVSGEVSVRLAAGTEAASATARPTPAPDAPGGAAC